MKEGEVKIQGYNEVKFMSKASTASVTSKITYSEVGSIANITKSISNNSRTGAVS